MTNDDPNANKALDPAVVLLHNRGAKRVFQGTEDDIRLVLEIRRGLRDRSNSELHFAIFNYLTGIGTRRWDDLARLGLEEILADYILHCRKAGGDADYMLCDGIVDHWPIPSSLRFCALTVRKCRYRLRVEWLLRLINRPPLRPSFELGVRSLALNITSTGDERGRALGREILRILRRDPVDRLRPIRVPTLSASRIGSAFALQDERLRRLGSKLSDLPGSKCSIDEPSRG